MTYHAEAIADVRIVIAADLRRELGIKDDGQVVPERDDGIRLTR